MSDYNEYFSFVILGSHGVGLRFRPIPEDRDTYFDVKLGTLDDKLFNIFKNKVSIKIHVIEIPPAIIMKFRFDKNENFEYFNIADDSTYSPTPFYLKNIKQNTKFYKKILEMNETCLQVEGE